MKDECAKSSLPFRKGKPAVATASRLPARADAPKVGLDEPASCVQAFIVHTTQPVGCVRALGKAKVAQHGHGRAE